MPKIVDGDLYAYVDIIDTPNGRLLKTLCDYGFVPGISSRGSGDVDMDNEVDPETFYLETFDIVALPAVKKARLAMCESLSKDNKSLKTALTESINAASEEDKEIMKEALDKLDIDVEEEPEEVKEELNLDDIPEAPADVDLLEESKGEAEEADAKDEADEAPEAEDIPAEEEAPEAEDKEEDIPAEDEEIPAEEAEPEAEDKEEDEAKDDEADEAATIGDFVKEMKGYDKGLALEFKPIVVGDKEIEVEGIEFDDGEEGKIVANIVINAGDGDDIDEDEAAEEIAEAEEPIEEPETTEEVSDAEPDGLVESFKEAIRQKEDLEKENRALSNEKAISDAEVKKLHEELNTYKISLRKVYSVAKQADAYQKEVKSLKEQLNQLKENESKAEESHSKMLNESVSKANAEVESLKESLSSKEKEIEEIEGRSNDYRTKMNESIKVAKAYKSKCDELTEAYISFRADLLGVRASDITSRLEENATIERIDEVCETLLTENVGSPAIFGSTKKVKINKSVEEKSKKSDE